MFKKSSAFFNDEVVNEILNSNDIEKVVSEYVSLKKKGKYLFGLCPFHREKTASFSVTPAKQIFYCYSCGKGGNVIHFIMNIENLTYFEAIKFLSQKAGISLPNEEEGVQGKIKQKQLLIKINTLAAKFFHQALNSLKGEAARKYLEQRGITPNTVRRFGIGYSLNDWDSLYKYLKKNLFNEEDILNSGLNNNNEKKTIN